MRNLILMLLVGVNGNAMAAEPDTIMVGEFGGNMVFAYPTSIHKAGNSVKMWDLLNASTPQNLPGYSPFLSKVSQVQYDCNEGRMRTLYTNVFSEKDGKGVKILNKDTSSLLNWQPVTAGTANEALFKYACGKK